VIVTLRQALGGDARRIHELVDELLDGEDSLIVLIDGRRAISFAEGFGLSPCQLELVAIEIERAVRALGGTKRIKRRERRTHSEKVDGSSNRARVREHLGRDGCRRYGGLVDRGSASGRPGDIADGNRGVPSGPVLRLAGKAATSNSG
jgi:hypothetical protein